MSEAQSTAAPRVRIRRLIDAPRAEVFAAWTDADAMRHWMHPGPMSDVRCELDAREGGHYRIIMVGSEGERWDHEGEYHVVDPPSKLVFTWLSSLTDRRETVVTVDLFERGDRTELVLTHERLPHAAAVERHTRGWTAIVGTLAEHMAASGETADVRGVGPRASMPGVRDRETNRSDSMTTRDTIQGYFDSLREKGEWEAYLSGEVVFTSFGTPSKRVTGRDAFLESTEGFYSMIQALEPKAVLVDGERACVLTRYELQPPGGPVFESHIAEVFEVREGKIESFDIYFDSAPFPA